MSKAEINQDGCTGLGCLGLIALVIVGPMLFSCDDTESTSSKTQAVTAADRQAGLHCIDKFGQHSDFNFEIMKKLRDPDSFVHEETRVTPNREGRHAIMTTFRAKNGFGGMNRDTAIGSFDHESCDASEPIMRGDF